MTNGKRIVVFEDDDEAFAELERVMVPRCLAVGAKVERYPGHLKWGEIEPELPNGSISNYLRSKYLDPRTTNLVLLDFLLEDYRHPVSRELVRGLSDETLVPLCVYHHEQGNISRARQTRRWQESEIAIDVSLTLDVIGNNAAVVMEGFEHIRSVVLSTATAGAEDLVEVILKAPKGVSSSIRQYSWGRAETWLGQGTGEINLLGRATMLGYWIHNQLLQFPGALVNATAAASYLGVDPRELRFGSPLFEKLASASYTGPFHELGPFWWTIGLDRIRDQFALANDETIPKGPELGRRMGLTLRPVTCAKGEEKGGYYCVITKKAICADHSVRPEGWLPLGAELCRIDTDEYEKISPYV